MHRVVIVFIVLLVSAIVITVFSVYYFGSGEPDSVDGPSGFVVSGDGGDTWVRLENARGIVPIMAKFAQLDPDVLYVGTEGSGLLKFTKDNEMGRVYDKAGILRDDAAVYDIAEDVHGRLIVAAFQKDRGRVIRIENNTGQELYFSPLENYGIFGVAIGRKGSKHIVAASGDGNFVESRDGGSYWGVLAHFNCGLVKLLQNPLSKDQYWALCSDNTLYRTTDGGNTWKETGSNLASISSKAKIIHSISYNKVDGALYVASDYGLLRSFDKGENWTEIRIPPPLGSTPVMAIATHPWLPDTFWVATGDTVYKTKDGGATWRTSLILSEQSISFLVVNPMNPEIIYAGLSK